MPGYFLNDFPFAEQLIRDLALPNLKLQFDIYHRQVLHGDVTMALRRLISMIGHVQIASVPSRNEPDGEELNFSFLFKELDRLGYNGFLGCEYRPRGKTSTGSPGSRHMRGSLASEATHDARTWFDRRRLYRRLRSCQHVNSMRPAHHTDSRRADRRPRASRGGRCRGRPQEPLDCCPPGGRACPRRR